MNDLAAVAKKSKDRSPNFPFINLERSIERARLFYVEEKRGSAPLARAAMHWGYRETSSSTLQTVSALKSYGLLAENAGGGGRLLQLTDLALRILLDQRPDSQVRLGFIQEAAKRPAVAAEVYERWPEGLPSDSTLSHFLVLERRFNEATAPSVVRILKENQQLAQMSAVELQSPVMETAEATISEVTSRDAPQQPRLVPSPPSVAVAHPAKSEHVEQLASLDGDTTVTLKFSGKPDAAFYEWIAFYASKKADKMKEAASKKKSDDTGGSESPS